MVLPRFQLFAGRASPAGVETPAASMLIQGTSFPMKDSTPDE
jgi:hypothetical protein